MGLRWCEKYEEQFFDFENNCFFQVEDSGMWICEYFDYKLRVECVATDCLRCDFVGGRSGAIVNVIKEVVYE